MDALKRDDARDFVTRQYASLLAAGLSEPAALARLREVLGAGAVEFLGSHASHAGESSSGHTDAAQRVVDAARRLGGNVASARASIISSLSDARLFALDWWRPIRTFLLYILFLLGLATVIASIYLLFVLPAFSHLDQTMGVRGGTAGWITAHGAVRLFAPVVLMAIAFAVLGARWWRMRQRLAGLEPLAPSRRGRRGARSAAVFDVLRSLEYAAALKASGVDNALLLDHALQAAGWPVGDGLKADGDALGEKLRQAARLGTFEAELEWQRRLHWSTTQAHLELSRDRLILVARVLFYILIGSMVTVLYLPIFSIASMIGVQ